MKSNIFYIPFSGVEFLAAVEGQEDYIIVAYIRLISYYWHHNHCEGLRNDSEFLRKICRIDKAYWEHAQTIICDNQHFFHLDTQTDLWHQKRCQKEWEGICRRIVTAKKSSLAGVAAKRKLGLIPPVKKSWTNEMKKRTVG